MKKQFVVGIALALSLGTSRMSWSAPVAAGPVAATDSKYLVANAQGSVYDFSTAELAVEKARSKAVQNYALRLLDDHARLNKMMLKLANQRGLLLPVTLADEDKTKLDSLMA